MKRALIPETLQRRSAPPMVLGVSLKDAREELFVIMVCDGLTLGQAYVRAGFKGKGSKAAHMLWQLDRIQERARAVLDARKATGAISLPQVTNMLERVFSSAIHSEQLNAAHNAAFSLARLYGHVTDKAQVEVLRKPSRDPDAPAEQSLSSWVDSLVDVSPNPPQIAQDAPQGPLSDARADLLAAIPADALPGSEDQDTASALFPSNLNEMPSTSDGVNARSHLASTSAQAENVSEIKWLERDGPVASENGAPGRRVTGTPSAGARIGALRLIPDKGSRSNPQGAKKKGAPRKTTRVPAKKGKAVKPVFRRTVIPDIFK